MKDKIGKLKLIQADGQPHPCPRCGTGTASTRTALSRYANVYICDECGTDEAIRDAAGTPYRWTIGIAARRLQSWAAVRRTRRHGYDTVECLARTCWPRRHSRFQPGAIPVTQPHPQ